MSKGKEKIPIKKGGRVTLSPFIVKMLKRLSTCSSKNSIQRAKALYEYLEPNRKSFV